MTSATSMFVTNIGDKTVAKSSTCLSANSIIVTNETLPGGMSGFISRATFAKDTSWRAEISVEAENIKSTNIRFVFYRF